MSGQNFSPSDNVDTFPEELILPPHEYVAFSGLDIANNVFHKAIWETMVTNRRSDRLQLHFKIVSVEDEYPKAKPKRTSYDQYFPRGVLKRNWMWKHYYNVPAVVVVFIDLDWDHPNWAEKQQACASKVETVRHSLEGRNTRIAVVLVQSKPTFGADDPKASDRATELCSTCDLSPKSLFVVPQTTDQLYGYVIRLEHAFYELAQGYYQNEIKRVKTKKDFLNKDRPNHQILLIRYNFKLGMFHDMKQDTHGALKCFKQGYQTLSEMKPTKFNSHEIRIVAGFFNYKICKLCFQHNTPLDAINQFKKHTDAFKTNMDYSELHFQHLAWITRQFGIFGDLFDAAIQNGLAAIQTQHPGFYYQSAANNAIARRAWCQKWLQTLPPYPQPDPLEQAGQIEYYGQRPWRSKTTNTAEALDESLEQAGLVALQWQEQAKQPVISGLVINLLSSAMHHFKRYRCPRMKRYVMVRLGEEYMVTEDFLKALQLFSHTIWEYRAERWWLPLQEVLLRALQCAFAVASIKEYVSICVELLGCSRSLNKNSRERIQANLMRVFAGNLPQAEPDLSQKTLESATGLWRKELGERSFFMIQMQNISSCIEARATFKEPISRSDSMATVYVYLRLLAPFPIQFTKLSVRFSNEAYDKLCVASEDAKMVGEAFQPMADGSLSSLYLLKDKVHVFKFQFYPLPEDVGKSVEVTSISLDIGQLHSNVYGTLHWEGTGSDTGVVSWPTPEYLVAVHVADPMERLIAYPSLSLVQVQPRVPKLTPTIEHTAPVLVGEVYPVRLGLVMEEDGPVNDLTIKVTCDNPEDAAVEQVLLSFNRADFKTKEITVELGGHAKDAKITQMLFIRSLSKVANFSVSIEVTYNIEVLLGKQMSTCKCVWNDKISLKCSDPFKVEAAVMTLKLEKTNEAIIGEPLVMTTEIACSGDAGIHIGSAVFKIEPSMATKTNDVESQQLDNFKLRAKECASTCCTLCPQQTFKEPVSVGNLVIKWKRSDKPLGVPVPASSGDPPEIETVIPLPPVTVISCPLLVTCDFPAYGGMRNPLTVAYQLKNMTNEMQEAEITMDSSDAFMFSGHKQSQVRLQPAEVLELLYILFPLAPGNQAIPRLKVKVAGVAQDFIDSYSQRNVPTKIFILPPEVPDPRPDVPLNQSAMPTISQAHQLPTETSAHA